MKFTKKFSERIIDSEEKGYYCADETYFTEIMSYKYIFCATIPVVPSDRSVCQQLSAVSAFFWWQTVFHDWRGLRRLGKIGTNIVCQLWLVKVRGFIIQWRFQLLLENKNSHRPDWAFVSACTESTRANLLCYNETRSAHTPWAVRRARARVISE